MSNVTKRRM